jgi:hypothetical protein
MSYNLTDLNTYTDEMSFELVSKAVLQTNLMEYSTIRSGLRAGNVAINLLDADISVQDRACGWDNNGTMTFSQVVIDIAEKQSKQELCPTDLRDYYLSERLSATAYAEEVPFPEVVSNLFVEKIKNWNENYLATQAFNIASAAIGLGGPCENATGPDTPDVNNIVGIVLDLFDAIDESVKNRDDLVVLMAPHNFALLRRALVAQNYFHYNQGEGTQDELIIPGTNMKAVKVTLTDPLGPYYNSMIAGPSKDLVIGVGLEDDFDQLRIFYDQSNDVVKVMAAWRIGVNFVDVCKWSWFEGV